MIVNVIPVVPLSPIAKPFVASFASFGCILQNQQTAVFSEFEHSNQWQMMRQISFCRLDMAWHSLHTTDGIDDVIAFEREAVEEYSLLPYEGGAQSTSFGHLFAGGYSAGYYSNIWAQVLDADAFEAFLENGLYHIETGQKFRHSILAKGGSKPPMDLYIDFRGREPDPDALLRREGLI